ncbi:hypothetical protein LSUE1_G003884 [Lachnellula suecica]|uniref:Uncharacterized protein n=1 Tax=Lachnellula suecica TaxID=602035 RepID=A0A8T9C835_9HELO|nr:hypothetical protein LSUE1_G003884 [Lachnellula suecica]
MRFQILSLAFLVHHACSSIIPTSVKGELISARSEPPSESSPNPIASQYPNNVTGTINNTIAVVPISYNLARSIIPSQYGILTKAYKSLLPGFPKDSYPLVVRAVLDHDIQVYAANISIPDFQASRAPNLLGDGYSSYTYSKYLLVTSTNLVAIAGVAMYGTIPVPSNFSSPQAYAFTNGRDKDVFLDAYTDLLSKEPSVTTRFKPTTEIAPWPLDFYKNVTNQPTFTNGLSCDNQLDIFNTLLSTGKNAPVGVKGDIMIKAPYLPSDSTFRGVHGIKVDVAFVENNAIPCEQLKGYSGTGSGD